MSNNVQYVRAGACTVGTSVNTRLLRCAVERTDCPVGSTFWSSSQLTHALASDAAACLQAAQTNQVLSSRCGNGSSSTTTGSCLVENFSAEDVYQCVVSKDGCASGDLYLSPAETKSSGGVTCNLCGLDPSKDFDLSDVTSDKNILSQFLGDDSSRQLEAVGIAGIVLGFLAGCGLLICVQRMCCKGRRRQSSSEPSAEFEKGTVGTDAADKTETDIDTKDIV